MREGKVCLDFVWVCRLLLLLAEILLLASTVLGQEISGEDGCSAWLPIDADERFDRGPGGNHADCYLVVVPEPGVLVVGAVVREPGVDEVKLDLLPSTALFTVSDRTPGQVMLVVSAPGTIGVRVAVQDHRELMPYYTFTSRLVRASLKDGDTGGSDEDEGEIDPIIGFRIALSDDHGDLPPFATELRLGVTVSGVLLNGVAADDDYFSFVLDRQQTVVIESGGETDTFGMLYGDRGYRLAAGDNGGKGAGFRIVKTLVPGRYFVRVAGRWAAEGTYSLCITPAG